QRELSPVDYLEALLSRIAAVDGRVHAFSNLDVEGARKQASVLAQEAEAGQIRGVLHGVPFAVKEQFAVRGMPDRTEPYGPEGPPAEDDAESVTRLREAGGILIGKTYMARPSSTPPTCNPWNLAHTPGGTSSGSGAAVGARMVPLALGEQTFGSN